VRPERLRWISIYGFRIVYVLGFTAASKVRLSETAVSCGKRKRKKAEKRGNTLPLRTLAARHGLVLLRSIAPRSPSECPISASLRRTERSDISHHVVMVLNQPVSQTAEEEISRMIC
jgi:hypothetical protein